MDKIKKPFHEIVAEKLIKQLEQGTAPWQRPWNPGESGAFLPYNPMTDNRYKGINSLYLMSQERDDQRWMTYKQATEAGAQVRKGEKGTGIQYWKFVDEHIKKDAAGKPLVDSDGKPVKELIKLERPRVFYATVFNAEQIDGLPPIQRKPQTWDPIERAEVILATCGVAIHYNGSDRAFYRPLTDSIHLPEKGRFPSADSFYATALHEIGHSSGGPNRLNRDLTHPFGSEGYAKEELRAEIASMILGDALGIGHDPSQHAAYVGSWIKVLKDDPMEIFRAAADAEKIQNYVLGLEQKHLKELAAQQDAEDLSAVLAVGLESVLQRPEEWQFDHYQDYEGASLDAALRNQGFNTVGDITGKVPGQFYTTAIQTLSPVFGIEPEDTAITNTYLERKGLAQAFQIMAERLVEKHRQQQSEVERIQINEVTAMTSTSAITPDQFANSVVEEIERATAGLAAWNNPVAQAIGEGEAVVASDRMLQGKYDQALAHLRTIAVLEISNSKLGDFEALTHTLEQGWRTWQHENGVGPAITPAMKRSFSTIPADLSQLSSATAADYLKAAELARIEEQRVKDDPNSTSEDITAAREQRKTADLAVTVHDSEFQKKVFEIEQQQADMSSAQDIDSKSQQSKGQNDKTYLNVPYREKNEAKALGASWDRGQQSWYIPAGVEQTPFSKWLQASDAKSTAQEKTNIQTATDDVKADRQYLAVPFSERLLAKAEGALWDKQTKSWYAKPTADLGKLQRWLPENVKHQQAPVMWLH
jgi:antirestriction protein ArdC